jgi:hypothetical protein|tara:strand:+ start:1385 stop:1567 length:183 start_codon:yes stop_codon:yes gene_type:complete
MRAPRALLEVCLRAEIRAKVKARSIGFHFAHKMVVGALQLLPQELRSLGRRSLSARRVAR